MPNAGASANGAKDVAPAAATGKYKKNLLQQLPAGSVLAFQALASTFTNQGNCYPSNWWLTVGLVTFISATCIFFSFTDSVKDSTGKVHSGVALPGRLHILNLTKKEQQEMTPELKNRGLKTIDWVHAALTAVVFLTIAGSDVGLQNCFFPRANDDTRQFLRNLPLGMAVIASFMFMIFPTTRKGISFSNSEPPSPANNGTQADKGKNKVKDVSETENGNGKVEVVTDTALPSFNNSESPNPANNGTHRDPTGKNSPSQNGTSEKTETPGKVEVATEKALTSSGKLLQLLPTGSVLAFQTLSATFTNQGSCYRSNWWLTVGLVTFISATCIFSSFTDSVKEKDDKVVHRCIALPRGLYIFGNLTEKQRRELAAELWNRRLKATDWVHAFFTAVLFLTIAGSDVGLQNCFFPKANDDTKQLLKNLPLGMAVMSSFVFMIFPTTRQGIGFNEIEYESDSVIPVSDATNTQHQARQST